MERAYSFHQILKWSVTQETESYWEGNRQEGQGSPKGENRLQVSDIFSVQFSHSVVSDSLRPHGLQDTRPSCPSPTPGACSNSCPLSGWCSSCSQSFLASGKDFQMSQFFASGGQSIGVSALAPVLPVNIQNWFPLGWTCWISLRSKGLSRVFSNTTVQKHQFFSAHLSSQSNSHIHTWPLEKP